MDYRPSPNQGPRTRPITAIVIHYTASMSMSSTVSWFMHPQAKASAHYLIGRRGEMLQMVLDNAVAWHAGRSSMRPDLPDSHPEKEVNVNSYSLGIELVGTADSGFTDVQMAALYSLLEHLIIKYRIRPERIVGHLHVAPGRKIDPDGFAGQFNWRRVREVAAAAYANAGNSPLTVLE